nr:solute carrier family 22 member 7-like [Dermacentor andersoni]
MSVLENKHKTGSSLRTSLAAVSRGGQSDRVASVPSTSTLRQAQHGEKRRPWQATADSERAYGSNSFRLLLLLVAQTSAFASYVQGWTRVVDVQPVDYWCMPPSKYSYMSTAQWFNVGIPRRPDGSYNHCAYYERPRTAVSEPSGAEVLCDHWHYNVSESTHNLLVQWDLVCYRTWLLDVAEAAFVSASALCAPSMGLASDMFGRWPVLYASVVVLFCTGVTQCFATTLASYVVLRFTSAASASVLELIAIVLLFESTQLAQRDSFVALAICFPTMLVPAYVAALNLYTRDWRILRLGVAAPSLLLIVLVHLTSESLDWLVVNGRTKEAERVLMWTARSDRAEPGRVKDRLSAIIDALALSGERPATVAGSPNFRVLFTGPMRYLSLCTFGCWFFSYVGYFSPSYAEVHAHVYDLRNSKLARKFA